MSTLKLSFSTLACPDWSWDDILRYGPQFGYQGVEVRLIQRETNLLIRPELQPDQLAARRKELDRTGFQVCGLASSVHLHDDDDALYAKHLRDGMDYLALAQSLGAKFIRIFGDMLPTEAPQRQTRMQRIADGLKKLGDAAGPRGVQVLIETHGDFSATEPNLELMRLVAHPHVGVLWDTHHPWRFHGEAIADSWQQLKPWTQHAHWKDSVLLTDADHKPESEAAKEAAALASSVNQGHQHADYVLFGGGEFPARECLRVMTAGGYDGWHSLEWEKMWHPDLVGPEVALPLFPVKMRELWNDVTRAACT